ncbi:hypothetical protein [Streptomyces morookaense]|uniref:Uncharacterized protein n=1 Tax=Streptomyces morookaense TaxID=1970 RepID=A0A7Y7E958_STRMO|nr:hypothetical protein [Streptomyces morookaense]NVK80071.1 hypothetical protein [Streptomyces morookaense]
MTERQHPLRRIAIAVSVAGLVSGMVAGAWWCARLWAGAPYPVADPAATARQVDSRTQVVYDVLGLPRAELDTTWPGRGLDADGSSCYRRGLRHWGDQLSDSPPSEPHTVMIYDTWALKGVSPAQAESALERARHALTQRGWTVTAYEHSRQRLRLTLTPPRTDITVRLEAYPGDRLQVAAHADCTRYPSHTPLGNRDVPLVPPQHAPAQLRG